MIFSQAHVLYVTEIEASEAAAQFPFSGKEKKKVQREGLHLTCPNVPIQSFPRPHLNLTRHVQFQKV